MTYPTGGHGYPPSQQPGPYPPAMGVATAGGAAARLPMYLLAAVVAFGAFGYLASFGPRWVTSDIGPLGGANVTGVSFAVLALMAAALLAAAGLFPRQRSYTAIVTVLALLGFLLAIAQTINKPALLTVGWAQIAIVILAGLQAMAAAGALLMEAGVIAPPQPQPQPQPRYDQYSPYGYYPQPPPGAPAQPPQPSQQQSAGPQRPAYPSYGAYPEPASSGGLASSGQHAAGPPTPPTGFPAYGQPSGQSGTTGQQGGAHQQPAQSAPSPEPTKQQPSSSSPSGPPPS